MYNRNNLTLLAAKKTGKKGGFKYLNYAFFNGGVNGGTTNSIDTTNSKLIVVSITFYAVPPIPILTDSVGNTFVFCRSIISAGAAVGTAVYYCINPITNISHSFTIIGSGSYSNCIVSCFSSFGVPLMSANNANSNTGNLLQAGAVSSVKKNSLYICVFSAWQALSVSINESFLLKHQYGYTGVNNLQALSYYLGSGSKNPTYSSSGTTQENIVLVLFTD